MREPNGPGNSRFVTVSLVANTPTVLSAEPARELRADVGVRDRAREHGLQRARVVVLALEEERPRLGVEQRERRVLLELREVGLDLREVGIQREVERQVRRDAPAHTEARLGLEVAVLERPDASTRRESVRAAVSVGTTSMALPGSAFAKPVNLPN